MHEAITEGWRVLDKVTPWAWVAFGMFIALELVYFYCKVISALKSMGSMVAWFFAGCKFDVEIETRFDTPIWEERQFDVSEHTMLCVPVREE